MSRRGWAEDVADRVLGQIAREPGHGERIVCASGISPSGPIHLGNLREVLTVHFVAEALRAQGADVVHIHSWDDFDRLRKIPPGFDPALEAEIGRPLADAADPCGEHASWADHFAAPFEAGLGRLAVRPQFIRQSQAYRRGDYAAEMRLALERRLEIFDVLSQFQTLERSDGLTLEERRAAYYPIRVYCPGCGKDDTRIVSYDAESGSVAYVCEADGEQQSGTVGEELDAKLVWKVDWPMRWAHERVDFEPGGVDHSSPGSSFDVGAKLVAAVFGHRPPVYAGYAFVGSAGRSKISGSAGGESLAQALDILEPPIVRWLYARRRPEQSFTIDFGKEVLRLYDEWDALGRRIAGDAPTDADVRVYRQAVSATDGTVERSQLPVPFRLLSSVADLTQGNVTETLRIVAEHLDRPDAAGLRELVEPRLSCAIHWALEVQPEEERTRVRTEFAGDAWSELDDGVRAEIELLVEQLPGYWSHEGLTALVYGVPKLARGLPLDAPADDELKRAQRSFFVGIYRLLLGADTGPRLPTLFLALGQDRLRSLLGPRALTP